MLNYGCSEFSTTYNEYLIKEMCEMEEERG